MEVLGSSGKKNSGNKNPRKKFLKFQETENPEKSFLDFGKWNFSAHPNKISYISGNRNPEKIPYIFSKESFSYILENGNLENILYVSVNRTFLYFKKGIFRTLA